MKTALDNYVRGKIKESNADDYNSNSYYVKGRFVCPECGEPVHLRPSKYANFFVHYRRTNENDECDRRVDGESLESIYERMGIPIYIRTDNGTQFYLYLGFKALPELLMQKAERENALITIDQVKRFSINRERFSIDKTVMVPVDYIPVSNQNYNFKIKPVALSAIVEKYWSNYADGFTYDGGLFTVTENGGRKIRHGDNVATETEYYWVRRQPQLPSYYSGIEMSLVGKLILRDTTWNVFKGHFSSTISDGEYRSLTNYLREQLRVHLIEKVPEIIPMWPPLIKDDDGYKYDTCDKKIIGRIISGNDEPRAYLYRGVTTIPEDLQVKNGVAEIHTRDSNIVINIDRKYISGGNSFSPITYSTTGEVNGVLAELNSNILHISGLDSKKVLHFKTNGEVLEMKKENEVEIDNLVTGDYVIVMGHEHIFMCICVVVENVLVNSIFDEDELLIFINKFRGVRKVFLPYKLKKQLMTISIRNKKIAKKITEIIETNEIEYPLVKLMEGYFDGR